MTDLEKFEIEFGELSRNEKISLYRDYQRENSEEEEWYDFDETFFDTFFYDKPMDAVRAWHFGGGDDNSWNHDYIHFNAYGNLETASDFYVANEAEDRMDEIFERPDVWKNYITLPDDEDEDEDEEDEWTGGRLSRGAPHQPLTP